MGELDIIKAFGRPSAVKQRYELMIPNCYTQHDNEADIFAVRSSGLCDEIEIKVSRSDFLVDMKKVVQYREWLKDSDIKKSEYHQYYFFTKQEDRPKISPVQKLKQQALIDGQMVCNYFWYAFPRGLIEHGEVPCFAGIYELRKDGFIEEMRKPKKLHSNKPSDLFKYQMARKTSYRYWDSLIKGTA